MWTIATREKDWDVVPRIVGPGGIDRPLKSILPPLVLRTPSTTFSRYNIPFFETLFLQLDHLRYVPSLQIDLTFPLNQLVLEKLVPLLFKINACRTWDSGEEDEDGSKRAKTRPFGERFSVVVKGPEDRKLLDGAWEIIKGERSRRDER